MTPLLRCLPEVGSTNAWAKEHFAGFGPIGAVYTTSQTAGRGRLGRGWANAAGQALYYTCVLKTPLADPGALPLYASLAVRGALQRCCGVQCAVKWPNDLLLGGKKLVGILCEGLPDRGGILCGIGVNLAQPQRYFTENDLPHATSLALQGVPVPPGLAAHLAETLTDPGFGAALAPFAQAGFAAIRQEYKAACINLGRRVSYEGGAGLVIDLDETGCLVVQDDTDGRRRIFTGEVSVHGIYGAV